jgi:hypothetical protein
MQLNSASSNINITPVPALALVLIRIARYGWSHFFWTGVRSALHWCGTKAVLRELHNASTFVEQQHRKVF